MDNFKTEFKRYKQRIPAPDFSDVIRFNEEIKNKENISCIKLLDHVDGNHRKLKGLKPVEEWTAYSIQTCPGFIVIPNPFEDGGQRQWIEECLQSYPLPPNVTNIDSLLAEKKCQNIWNYSKENHLHEITSKNSLMMKLRWVTLGYHYDWNEKKYFPERVNEFPSELSALCKYIASVIGFEDFSPEAAIVNYYHMDSTLAGHTDHSELDHDAPLISISFGQDAIFLIGGLTKETKPVAIMLHSGDICIMSGQSRLAYHAVPRILPADPSRLNRYVFSEKSCGYDLNSEQSDFSGQNSEQSCLSCSHSNKADNGLSDEVLKNKEDSCKKCYSLSNTGVLDKRKYEIPLEDGFVLEESRTNEISNTSISLPSSSEGSEPARLHDSEDELLFREYLQCTRININVRQVLHKNQIFSKVDSDSKRIKLDVK